MANKLNGEAAIKLASYELNPMILIDQIKSDIITALKAGDSLKTETLRGILSVLHNEEIALRSKQKGTNGELDEKTIIAVLKRETKKRKEATEIYTSAGRDGLAKKERDELEIIQSYLPPAMDLNEIKEIAGEVVASGIKNFGEAMRAVIDKTGGGADAKEISEVLKNILEKNGAEGGGGK